MKLFLNQRDGRMIEELDRELVQRAEPQRLASGYLLRNRTGFFDIPDNWVVHAEVGDRKTWPVIADFTNPQNSACGCGHAPYCEHVLAVVFQVYERFGVSTNALLAPEVKEILDKLGTADPKVGVVRAKSTSSSSQAGSRQPSKSAATPSTPAPRKQATPPPKPQGPEQTGTVASWREHFEQKFPSSVIPSPDFIEGLYELIAEKVLLPLARGWDLIPRTLYHLQVILYVLELADRSFANARYTYYAYRGTEEYNQLQDFCWEQVQSLAKSFSLGDAWQGHADLLRETAGSWTRSATASQEGCVLWVEFFRLVWWNFLNISTLADEERVRLRRQLKDPALPDWKSKRLYLLLAHLDVATGNDEQAMQVLLRANDARFQIDNFNVYIQTFLASRVPERALAWLRFGQKWLGQSRTHAREQYWNHWEALCRWMPVEEEWERALRSELPREQRRYGAYLLNKGRYRQWAELQLIYDVFPEEMNREELRVVTAHDPEVLLPLYLQAVERLIVQKNRDAYKQAVRWLKKAKTIYNKRKATSQWQTYLSKLLDRHSRLRALREEVEKGKLLS